MLNIVIPNIFIAVGYSKDTLTREWNIKRAVWIAYLITLGFSGLTMMVGMDGINWDATQLAAVKAAV